MRKLQWFFVACMMPTLAARADDKIVTDSLNDYVDEVKEAGRDELEQDQDAADATFAKLKNKSDPKGQVAADMAIKKEETQGKILQDLQDKSLKSLQTPEGIRTVLLKGLMDDADNHKQFDAFLKELDDKKNGKTEKDKDGKDVPVTAVNPQEMDISLGDNSPVKLRVKLQADGANQPKMSFTLEMADPTKFSADVLKMYNPKELEDFINTKINPNLDLPVDFNVPKDSENRESVATAMKGTIQNIKDGIFDVSDQSNSLIQKTFNAIKADLNPNDPSSDVYQKLRAQKKASNHDGAGGREAVKELNAKVKVNKWLLANKAKAAKLDTCGVIKAALNASEIPEDTQSECEDTPDAKGHADVAKAKKDFTDADAKDPQTQAAATPAAPNQLPQNPMAQAGVQQTMNDCNAFMRNRMAGNLLGMDNMNNLGNIANKLNTTGLVGSMIEGVELRYSGQPNSDPTLDLNPQVRAYELADTFKCPQTSKFQAASSTTSSSDKATMLRLQSEILNTQDARSGYASQITRILQMYGPDAGNTVAFQKLRDYESSTGMLLQALKDKQDECQNNAGGNNNIQMRNLNQFQGLNSATSVPVVGQSAAQRIAPSRLPVGSTAPAAVSNVMSAPVSAPSTGGSNRSF